MNTRKMIYSALCLALCMVLPFLTGQIPQIGSAISPLHIPVLICGFICGPAYGAVLGLITPPLRFMFFGMPPIFPIGTAMMFELAVYGLVSGLLYKLLPKKDGFVYPILISAMLCGRIVWGISMVVLNTVQQTSFTWAMFLSGAFINAVPGIIIHIVLIPLIVIALKKAGYVLNE